MLADSLRKSILRAAIEGKLTEQRPDEDGDARDLLAEIQKEKTRLVKEGKIRRANTLPPIADDEIPFDIPENWCWVRLGEITNYANSKQVHQRDIPAGALVVELEDIEKDICQLLEKHYDRTPGSSKNQFSAGDVLYGKLRPYLKKTVILQEDGYCSTEIVPFRGYGDIEAQYLMYVMISPEIDRQINSLTYGMDMPRLGRKDAVLLPVPLPPLAEQRRIVARLEELLPLVEELGKNEKELDVIEREFPAAIRKSLLQAAIEGKLTERQPDDGDARDLLAEIQKEKTRLVKEGKIRRSTPLPPVADDEIPFDIPENWVWCKLNDIAFVTKLAGFEYTKCIVTNLVDDGIPLFKGKNIQDGRLVLNFESYISEEVSDSLPRSQLNKKCLLTPYVGTIGNIAVFNGDFKAHLGSNVGKIEFFNDRKESIVEEYVLHYLRSPLGLHQLSKYKKATAQESISIEAIRDVILCVPPLAEQRRIVARLEELLPLVEDLKEV